MPEEKKRQRRGSAVPVRKAKSGAHKTAEEVLLAAGALQRAIFNSANFSCIATDASGVIQIFNVGAERMLGYTAAEVVNRITPADISDPHEVIARAEALSLELDTPITPGFEALVFKASRGIEDIYELTYIRKDSTRFPAVVSVTALRDAQGAIIGYLLIGTDNTARKQIEADRQKLDQRLRDQQFYTRSLIESNIDALMTTDPQGIITDVNRQMEQLTGSTRDELIGAPFKDFFTDPGRAEAAIKLVLRDKKVNDYELTARSRNGAQTVVSYNATTFYDRSRTLQGVFAAARDITEHKRVEAELQQANAAKSRFLAAASHDLRQPLQTLTLLQGLLAKQVVSEKAQKLTARMDQTLISMADMLNALLDINQIETGIVTAELTDFPVGELLERLTEEVSYLAQARNLVLRTVPCSLSIRSDPRLLEQIIRNLISNALKYTETGKILIGCRRDAGSVRIEVWDTGVGISPRQLDAIFEEYHQVDNDARERSRGLGLGLAIVRRLGKLLNHPVHVRSHLGKGSVFSIATPLPLSTVQQQSQPSAQIGQDAVLERRPHAESILIVEDAPEVRELLGLFLEGQGYEVTTAPDGPAALRMIAAGTILPDLVLADYNLPKGMSGLEFVTTMQRNLKSDVPFIILTGDISTGTSREIESHGYPQINKPVKTQELTEAIQQLLARPRTTNTLDAVGRVPAQPGATPARAIAKPITPGATVRIVANEPRDPAKQIVYVVDDDVMLLESMREMLTSEGYAVGGYGSAEAFLAAGPIDLRGCLLVDGMMPGISGLELLERLKAQNRMLPSIVITGHGDVSMAISAMKCGALDFIEKPAPPEALLAIVAAALAHGNASAGLMSARDSAITCIASLTRREREVMDLVVAGQLNKVIAANLRISQRTVEVHRAAVMTRTGAKSLPDLIRLVMRAA